LTWLVNPGVPISPEATAVHGVTDEQAATGTPAEEAIPAIVRVLADQISRGVPVVAFNARFDLTMLDRECRRYGVEPLDYEALRVIDPLVIDKWLNRFRRGSRKLDAMCEHYGATLDDAHDASSDAIAAARLAWVLAKRGEVVATYPDVVSMRTVWKNSRDDLNALHRLQVGWAHAQAVSLAEYFKKKGTPQHVETAWPVVPYVEAAAA
jgi:DNA polymerase-3 subunit epsilon